MIQQKMNVFGIHSSQKHTLFASILTVIRLFLVSIFILSMALLAGMPDAQAGNSGDATPITTTSYTQNLTLLKGAIRWKC